MNLLSSDGFHYRNELTVASTSNRGPRTHPEANGMVRGLLVAGDGTEQNPLVVTGEYMRDTVYAGHQDYKESVADQHPESAWIGSAMVDGLVRPVHTFARDGLRKDGSSLVDLRLLIGEMGGDGFVDTQELAVVRRGVILSLAEVAMGEAGFDTATASVGGTVNYEVGNYRDGITQEKFGAIGLPGLAQYLENLPHPQHMLPCSPQ